METKKFDTNESINLIMNMVNSTRHNIAEDKVTYLLWGYAVAVSAIIHYVLLYSLRISPNSAWLVWLSMPVLGIINGLYFAMKKKTKKVKTFVDRAMSSIWISFVAALITFLFAAPVVGWNIIYPMFMVLYGIGSAASGGVLKFKPLIIGGAISMALGGISFYLDFQVQLLLLALAVVASFVIPAHALPKS